MQTLTPAHSTQTKKQSLTAVTLLFPFCLVLYEFSTYICNDMIQPGMLAVVQEYGVGIEWVPTSMTAYLAGGIALQWLLGPLSTGLAADL